MRLLARSIAGVLLALFCTTLCAHEVRPAALDITETAAGIDIQWRAPVQGDYTLALAPRLSSGWLDAPPATQSVTTQTLTRAWHVPAGAAPLAGQQLRVEGLERTLTDVFVRVHWRHGDETMALLKPLQNTLVLQPATGRGAAVREYFHLGVTHIWGGYDHLLYLAGLILLVRRPRAVLGVVTAFTLAHSLTLAASALGLVHLPPAPVEAAIALSILFVAVELARGARGESGIAHRHPWSVAFLFGLLHGFGFAGALREVGLPDQAIATPLLLFNLGIEAGQILFVAALMALGWLLLRRRPALARGLLGAAPVVMGALAAWWLFERLAAMGARA
ncbi:MAG TPA: HupE/UreJ family protein [Steroidobacteraceae bacterium]|nr:HupE/UreJ family protein [Steroidobacteraceae bacterium]